MFLATGAGLPEQGPLFLVCFATWAICKAPVDAYKSVCGDGLDAVLDEGRSRSADSKFVSNVNCEGEITSVCRLDILERR